MKNIIFVLIAILVTNFISAQTVYVTKTGKKYHYNTCQHISKSATEINQTDAINKGYTACSKCQKGIVTNSNSISKKSKIKNTTSESVQCTAITKKGTRCKRKATQNSKCYQH